MSWFENVKLRTAPYWIYSQLVTVFVVGVAVIIWGLVSNSPVLVIAALVWTVIFGAISGSRLRSRR